MSSGEHGNVSKVDVPSALAFPLLLWFFSPWTVVHQLLLAGCVSFSMETCLFAVICCALTRGWEAANVSRASGEVWCDRLYVSFQCMKIQTWCEIDTSSPLARSWNEWFINWGITGAHLNGFHISKHSIWIYYTLNIYIFLLCAVDRQVERH